MMRYGRYSFSCILEKEAILPPYKGSTFRGVFGVALKKVVCALKHQECQSCLLRGKCVYARAFELSSLEPPPGSKKRIAAAPHPYVIEPDASDKQQYSVGESFNFVLILFGEMNEYLPYFVYAIEQMGQIGIGKKINGTRSRFKLENVAAGDGEIIFSRASRVLKGGQFAEDVSIEQFSRERDNVANSVTVKLETPLRLKYGNKLESKLPFHVLIRAALRRLSSLCTYYGDGEPDLEYTSLVKKAEQIEIERDKLQWVDWRRFSNRQDQAMFMGGICGSVVYRGDIAEFIPLLRISEKLHLGKQTTFGLGKITILDGPP
jgi:CRISPR-associated endoribonuclease Cas6